MVPKSRSKGLKRVLPLQEMRPLVHCAAVTFHSFTLAAASGEKLLKVTDAITCDLLNGEGKGRKEGRRDRTNSARFPREGENSMLGLGRHPNKHKSK